MNLVEVDRVDPEPLQAGVGLAQDGIPLEAVDHSATGAFEERALCKYVWALAHALQGSSYYLL